MGKHGMRSSDMVSMKFLVCEMEREARKRFRKCMDVEALIR
jgi:hypothetical protein